VLLLLLLLGLLLQVLLRLLLQVLQCVSIGGHVPQDVSASRQDKPVAAAVAVAAPIGA
jgi:hypothetical protein